jgi:tRNA G10  N-methylase Trm11
MCGKGTTLFEAMTDGYNAYGIDENKGAIHDMGVYFSRYLKEGHYKHQMEKGKAIVGGKNIGETLSFKVSKDKEAAKRKEFIEMKCIAADASKGGDAFKKSSIDVIACDLPYGIAHIGKKGKQSTRSIAGILDGALDSWDRLLKKGGTVALAWNTFTDSKQDIVDCLGRHGFVECPDTENIDFSHRVSQAINRDLVFALKR